MYFVDKKWGILITLVFVLCISGSLLMEVSMALGFFIAILIALIILKIKGVNVKELVKIIVKSEKESMGIFVVILLIGANVSMWISSGIVSTMIYYGFDIIDKVNLMVFSFLATGIFSIFIGTGLGTLSTVGIAILTLGVSIGLPPQILVGVIMSGSYLADRASPISALVNVTLDACQSEFKKYIKKMVSVVLPTSIISIILYYIVSLRYKINISPELLKENQEILSSEFVINPMFFIIPMIVLILALLGVKTRESLLFGIISGGIISVVVQGNSITSVIGFLFKGFVFENSVSSPVLVSLESGGIMGMVEVVIIVMGGIAMSVIFQKCEFINPILEHIEDKSKSKSGLYMRTGFLSIFMNMITCDQIAGILIPSKFFKETFLKFELDEDDLAEMISNSGTTIAPLMPWNVNAVIILSLTGVSALEYMPYSFMLLLSFPASIIIKKVKE